MALGAEAAGQAADRAQVALCLCLCVSRSIQGAQHQNDVTGPALQRRLDRMQVHRYRQVAAVAEPGAGLRQLHRLAALQCLP